jgi:hypothetical protein
MDPRILGLSRTAPINHISTPLASTVLPNVDSRMIKLKEISIIIGNIMHEGNAPDLAIPVPDTSAILWNILRVYGRDKLQLDKLQQF